MSFQVALLFIKRVFFIYYHLLYILYLKIKNVYDSLTFMKNILRYELYINILFS